MEERTREAPAATARVHRLCHQLRVALHPLLVIREAAVRVVQQMPLQTSGTSLDARVLVDLSSHPAAPAPVVEAYETVGIGIAVTQEAAEILRNARNRPAGMPGEAAFAQPLDLFAQLLAHALVGIEAKHPVIAAARDGEILLRAKSLEVPLDDAGAERRGELLRAVARVRVDDYDLITECDGAQARLDAVGFVVRDDGCGKPWSLRGWHARLPKPRRLSGAAQYILPADTNEPRAVLRSRLSRTVQPAHARAGSARRHRSDCRSHRRGPRCASDAAQ